MNRLQELQHITANLQTLVASFSSVADFCRRLDVNRQQFNKYLAGQHLPSRKVRQQIARHFLMEGTDLSRAPADFRRFYDGLQYELPVDLRATPQFTQFLPLIRASAEALRDYCGVYYRYHNSSIYKGSVLRSVLCIYERGGSARHVTIERFPGRDGRRGTGYAFAYHGFSFLLGDRIFLLDFEGAQQNEMTFTVLTPQHRRPLRFLHGLVTGVASSSFRQPFSTRIALAYAGPGPIRKQHLRQATTLAPDDASIPPEMRDYLTGERGMVIWGGEG